MKRPIHSSARGPSQATLPVLLGALALAGCADRATPAPVRDGATADVVSVRDAAAEIAQRGPDGGTDTTADEGTEVPLDGDTTVVDAAVDEGLGDAPADVAVDDASQDAGCAGLVPTCVSATTSHVCDTEKGVERDVVCPLGCQAEGPRAGACREVTPSNGFPTLTCGDDRVSPVSFDVREPTELDPDHGSYSTVTSTILAAPAYVTAFQGGSAPSVGIFHLAHLTIDEGQTLTIRKGAASAVVFLVDGDVEISGTLDVGATGNLSGAGVASLGAGLAGPSGAGAGGGSFATAGGAGGTSNGTAGGSAGILYGSDSLIPLFGGSPGGGAPLLAGGGGGAVQISACGRVHVGPRGRIRAVGGGGLAGAVGSPGSGGGSGGAILLEGRTLLVEGVVTANGGAGAGAASDSAVGSAGEDGSSSPALGAMPGQSPAGEPAGVGSCANGAAGDASASAGPTGGGGGGLGRVHLATMDFSVASSPPSLTGSLSPSPTLATWPTR